jgi:multisubunit Na+/H+ antiporter MnhB subunit
MLDTSLGFSAIVSMVITALVYFVSREKNKTEQQQKDKLNDTIIVFIITFIVVLFSKLCLGGESSSSTILVKQTDMKGGQCPF